MNIRSELEGAWKETVKEDYLNGTIATERDLQASIYRVLRIKSPAASVFLEAGMLAGESGATPTLPRPPSLTPPRSSC